MNKPFEVAALVEKLKANGVKEAEVVAKILAESVIDWAVESCALHENAFVKVGGSILAAAKPAVMKEIDKIDGQVSA